MKRTPYLVILFSVLGFLGSTQGLRRHERHRRVSGPDPNPAVFGIVKDEQKENKFKPKFERCDDYQPEVLEEEPVGKPLVFIIFV